MQMHKRCIISCVALLLSMVYALQVQAAGSRIVSANTNSTRCNDVKSYSRIQANAYHVKDTSGVNNALAQTQYGKPIILSDDGADGYANNWWGSNPTQLAEWAGLAAAAGEHYEHNDPILIDATEGGGPYGLGNLHADTIACLQILGNYATPLTPNGTLTRNGSNFYWNGQEIQLFGNTVLGSMIMNPSSSNDYMAFLDLLQQYGNNFTRTWVINQWQVLGNGLGGICAYSGSQYNWNLDVINETFITRMHGFMQAAANRGIVVQLSLSDRCGLKNQQDWAPGDFHGSPYYLDNNNKSYLAMPGSLNYARFLDIPSDYSTNIYLTNDILYRRIASELKNYGNLIIEIMNEPTHSRLNDGWSDLRISAWHKWVADIVDEEFSANPTEVSIDLGTTNANYGITLKEPTDGNTTATDIGGINCRRNTDPGAPSGADYYMYFDVADNYAYQGNQSEHYITIHYYDTGSGSLALQYDSTSDSYSDGGSVNLTGLNVWKQHTFHVTDAYFGNRQNEGSDFRIQRQPSGEYFYLDIVEARLTVPPNVPPVANIDAIPINGNTPLTVSFDGSGSYDPDGGAIVSYQWDFDNDGTVDVTDITTNYEYRGNTTFVAKLTVTDSDTLTGSTTVNITVNAAIADFNYDGDVDQEDFGHFQECMTGTGEGPPAIGCEDADLDNDDDVDMEDFTRFQDCMSGADIPADVNCGSG
ncbi:MAG: PKD domain-containing protein [Planctomycetota bacterium]|nr:MAG: PKD domain-containing protein [Planctomycetota bacterium]